MNRIDFMKQLESLLQNISPAEREEALQYYNDYFNDAGVENEQDVIEALGNPAKVAETIKRDLYGSGYMEDENSRYNTYQRAAASDRAVVEYENQRNQNDGGGSNYTGGSNGNYSGGAVAAAGKKGNSMSTGMIVLIVVLCILASPLIGGLLAGVLGAVIGILGGWFGAIIGFGAAAIALLVLMVVLLVAGISALFVSPAAGVGLIGASLICGGLGILFAMLVVAMAGIATPAIVRFIISGCRKLFGRKTE